MSVMSCIWSVFAPLASIEHTHNKTRLKFPCGKRQLTKEDAEMGIAMGEQMIAHFGSLRHLCLEVRTEEELNELKVDVLEELQTKTGIMCCFHMALARKAKGNSAARSEGAANGRDSSVSAHAIAIQGPSDLFIHV